MRGNKKILSRSCCYYFIKKFYPKNKKLSFELHRHTKFEHSSVKRTPQGRGVLCGQQRELLGHKQVRVPAAAGMEHLLSHRAKEIGGERPVDEPGPALCHILVDHIAQARLLPLQRLHAHLPYNRPRLRALLLLPHLSSLSHTDHVSAHTLVD